MSGSPGSARAISRKTVRPPTPESKMPMGRNPLLTVSPIRHHPRSSFAFDVVLLDLLVEIRARRVDGLRGARDVPAVLAELGQDERLLRFVLELLERRHLHGAGDDVRRCPEELR